MEEARVPAVTIEATPESSSPPQVVVSSSNADVTPSVSSDSVSFPTQMENQAAVGVSQLSPAADEVSQKLSEASLQETVPEERPAQREEPAREEVAQDLRVFELNSDSGKSTPSNNGKKGEREETGLRMGMTRGSNPGRAPTFYIP